MSMYLLPTKQFTKEWTELGSTKKKYYLVKWAVIKKTKEKKGGLGIKDLILVCSEDGGGNWKMKKAYDKILCKRNMLRAPMRLS